MRAVASGWAAVFTRRCSSDAARSAPYSLQFIADGYACPKPPEPGRSEALNEGEDALFVTARCIGVADGVGSWAHEKGIDAGEFSRGLMNNAHAISQEAISSGQDVEAIDILCASYERLLQAKVRGSTTATIAALSGAQLSTANVGDSGWLVIRATKSSSSANPDRLRIVSASEKQYHGVNRPFQLGHHEQSDKPIDAAASALRLLPWDLLVLATDGLYDNISRDAILRVIHRHWADAFWRRGGHLSAWSAAEVRVEAKQCAVQLTSAAFEASQSTRGGKPDDISVVCAICVTESWLEGQGRAARW